MARKRKNKQQRRFFILGLVLAIIIYIFLSYAEYNEIELGFEINLGEVNFFRLVNPEEETELKPVIDTSTDGNMEELILYVFDIGQGDSIFIQAPDGNMLIDTSVSSERDELTAYLAELDVTVIDYLVLTHPDADHIGNADYIIQNYDVENIIKPDFSVDTKTYGRMIDAIEASDANVIDFEIGDTFYIGELENTILAPISDYSDPNEMSIVIKSVYGETSIMLTGDAEKKSEKDIVDYWASSELDCDILKVGHHGSRTSTTDEFLSAVTPEVALISCGVGNTYLHPHTELLDRLYEADIPIYRTDEDGTIIITTDGVEYQITTVELVG